MALAVTRANGVGDHLDLTVTTSGCPKVSTLNVLNQGQLLKPVSAGTGALPVTLSVAELPFGGGIPGVFSLTAEVTCADGRKARSTPVSATLFPAVRVFTRTDGTEVVPATFYAEGSAGGLSFVGCRSLSATQTELVRVNTAGDIAQANPGLPIPCKSSTWFTEHTVGGVRWMVTPGSGALAYDENLNVITQAQYNTLGFPDAGTSLAPLLPLFLSVGPDGDAVILVAGANSRSATVVRAPHSGTAALGPCQPNVWCTAMDLPQAPARIDAAGTTVTVTATLENPDAGQATFQAQRLNYASGAGVVTSLWPISYPQLSPATAELTPDGTLAFFPYDSATTSGLFNVVSLVTDGSGSVPHWLTGNLSGTPEGLFLSGDGVYVAAVAAERTWFLSASTGVNVGHGGQPLAPTAPLITTAIQQGPHSDFYLLNGVAGQPPSELVATDAPDAGELFRLSAPDGGASLAFDDSGQLWLRLGNTLVQTLPVASYRNLR